MTLNDRVLRHCLRRPRLTLATWALLLVGLVTALGVRLLAPGPLIDNSVGIWFLKDDPGLKVYEQNNDAFGRKEWSILLLEPESVSSPAFLRDLARLTAELEAQPHVRRVLSLVSVRALAAVPGKGPAPAPVMDPASTDPAKALWAALRRQPDLERLLLPQGWGGRTVLLIQSDNFLHDTDPYRMALVDAVHRLVQGCPSIRSHAFAGTPVINAELNRSARRDALRFYLLVTLMAFGFGWIALRDLRDLAVVAAVLLVSVLGPMAAIALRGIPFNMVTILLPLILVSLSVCDVIHVINAFHGERAGLSALDAARAALHRLWTPCLCTSVVTVAGMLSLAVSTVAPIRQLGLFTSLGLAFAWASTMTLVPALLVLFWEGRRRDQASGWAPGRYGSRLLPCFSGRWRWLWLSLAAGLLAPMAGIPRLCIDTDYAHFFSPSAPVSQAYGKLKEAQAAQSVIEIVVSAPAPSSLDEPSSRRGMADLERRVRQLPQVRHTLSEGSLMEQVDLALNGPAQPSRWSSYPAAAAKRLRQLARERGLAELDDYATLDGSRRRILVLTDYMSSRELDAFRRAVDGLARQWLPGGLEASVEGTTVLWADMDHEIGTTQVTSILALALVFAVLLPLLFRSLQLGLLGILINGLPLAMTFGLMGLLGVRLNMATALIGGISLGSTVDSTIFFISRFQAERTAGRAWEDAIASAVRGVGDGILITTGILVGGFLCMTVSSFLPTAHLGALTCFTVLTGAFFDIIVNPILLGLLAPRQESTGCDDLADRKGPGRSTPDPLPLR